MILKVNKDICEIKQNEVWNVGDYNVHTVQVELSPEFNGLVNKVRYFIEDNSYDMLITDNVAQVPYEATLTEGTIKIGVYGYDADTDILVQSTSPVNKYITSGTYTGDPDNTQPLTPTDKEQMETAIQKNTDDITDLKANKQDKLISGVNIKTINNESILSGGNLTLVTEETDPIFTNSPAYSITDNDITYWNNKANISDIPDVSNFITKDVDNLTYYTKSTDMQNAIDNAVNIEKVARENADNSLQNQIDAITVSSDVVDVVSTYQDLVDYDTQHIKANDIIKVMQDSTHDNAISYYRWVIVNHVGSWVYVGSEGPYYTKSEADTLLNAKQNTITNTNKLQSDLVDDTNQTNLFVTSTEKTTWNNKLDQSDLTDYVKNTDYASSSKGGVIKTGSNVNVDNNGVIYADNQTYSDYSSSANTTFISKGTLENVITGKNLETANNKVTSISSSSTDVQYPSAKCVYDNDVIIKDDVNTKYDYLFSLTNLFEKITATGTNITLNNTSDTMLKIGLNANDLTQGDNPSPDYPQEIHTVTGDNEVNIVGKNLFKAEINSSQFAKVNITKINDNKVQIENTTNSLYRYGKFNIYNLKKNTTYSFRAKYTNSNSSAGTLFLSAWTGDMSSALFDIPFSSNAVKIFNTGNNTFIVLGLYSTASTATINTAIWEDIQLVEGEYTSSTMPEYMPYQSQTYPITLGNLEYCKIGDYSDEFVKQEDKWYLKKNVGKVVLDGSETWVKVRDYVFTNKFDNCLYPTSPDVLMDCLCNNFTRVPNSATWNNYDSLISYYTQTGGRTTVFRYNQTKEISDFTTWLSTHNTEVYYVLETPTYTLLNDTLQTQLNNIQYALAYDTQTNISQTNTDLPFIINAETYVDLTDYVKNTDYATSQKGGVIKTGSGTNVDSNGNLYASNFSYANYQTAGNNNFISKGTLENVITGKELITSSYHDSTKQNVTDESLNTVNKNIVPAINEVDSIAKGANQALSYGNYSTMITAFNSLTNNVYNVGQNVMIITLQVPDLWISGIESTSQTYTYTTDEAITTALSTNGYIQVGYYKLSALETQKVDLTDYATKTYVNNLFNSIVDGDEVSY